LFRKLNDRFALSVVLVGVLASGVVSAVAQERQDDPQAQTPEQSQKDQSQTGVIIPPAPLIQKRNPNTIAIPLTDAAAKESKSTDDSKYEEKPAAISNAKVGSTFGYRRDPFTGRARFHAGLDIKARWGDPVGASQRGIVQFAGWSHGYGNLIVVDHGGGVTTHYAHLSSFALEVGQPVERGTVVGYAGSTGRATAPHLHYEVRIDGSPVNPQDPVALDPSSPYFERTAASATDSKAAATDSTMSVPVTTAPAAPAPVAPKVVAPAPVAPKSGAAAPSPSDAKPAATEAPVRQAAPAAKDRTKTSSDESGEPASTQAPQHVVPARGKNG
jgi:murein DD-endopeptidase MepM/ murein hydrolase activator NlpD